MEAQSGLSFWGPSPDYPSFEYGEELQPMVSATCETFEDTPDKYRI